LRAWGEKEGLQEFTLPSVDLDRADGTMLSLIASEVCKASGYYRDPYEGGALFLLLFAAFRKSIGIRTMVHRWKGPALIAFFVFIGGLLFTYGIWFSGPTTASFVIQFTTVFSILAGVAFLKERFTRFEALGIVLAVAGLLAISYTSVEVQLFSLALLLLGAASWGWMPWRPRMAT
jgi:drug/metabolite transporter (DMT)-like permease